eukprot:6593849-Prymnesium_polylepis.1
MDGVSLIACRFAGNAHKVTHDTGAADPRPLQVLPLHHPSLKARLGLRRPETRCEGRRVAALVSRGQGNGVRAPPTA